MLFKGKKMCQHYGKWNIRCGICVMIDYYVSLDSFNGVQDYNKITYIDDSLNTASNPQ